MLYFEFGQDRLAEAHPLKAFKLGQGAIKTPAFRFKEAFRELVANLTRGRGS
jgi:hypothetical protein